MLGKKETIPHEFLYEIVAKLRLNDQTVILILASIVGLIGGLGAIGFRELISLIQNIAIGSHTNILSTVSALPTYYKLILPIIGGLIVGPLVYYLGEETKGHGVPEVMEAVAIKGGRIRSRVMVLKAFVSAVTIGTGGSVGREGPIVQIGSSLGSTFGQLLKMSNEKLRILVASGAAAGIAATFNAPLAGVLFSVEIIMGSYAITTLLPLILSSVLATIVGRLYFGDIPAFEIPHYSLVSVWEIGPYIIMGILAGVVAVIFIKTLYSLEDFTEKIPIKNWLKTPIVFSIIGLIIVFFPHVYGVGYDTITPVLKGEIVWYILLILVPIKIIATSIALAGGGSGGIFVPSLFLGAVFGGSYGMLVELLFPSLGLASGAYAVVGMSAMVAGTTHAPITAFLVIFEMTGDYKLILPIMICSILASFVASSLEKDSIYSMKLSRRGVDVSRGIEVSVMQATHVKDVMRRDALKLHESTGLHDILKKVMNVAASYFYVVDNEDTFLGSFSIHDVKSLINEQALEHLVVAKDLVSISISPFITEKESLADCMQKFSRYDTEELPVVDYVSSRKLVGHVSRRDIITIYDREILREGSPGLKLIQSKPSEKLPSQSYLDLPDGFTIHLFHVKNGLSGKTLKELDLRNKYGVTIIAINKHDEEGEKKIIVPDPRIVLRKGHILITLGKIEDLIKFKIAFRLS